MKNTLLTKFAIGMAVTGMLITPMSVPTQAQTTSDLQIQIQKILEYLASTQGQTSGGSQTTASCSYTWSRTLTVGSIGEDVRQLQKFLNKDTATQVAVIGAGSIGSETTYFGPATRQAVIKFQNKYRADILTPVGLTMGTGFVGQSTITKLNTLCKTTTSNNGGGNNNGGGQTTGQEGEIIAVRGNERASSVDFGKTAAVYSVDLEVEDSDIALNRVDFMFDKKPWQYLDKLTLVYGDDDVATINAVESNFTRSGGQYRVRFSNINLVVEEGDEEALGLEVTAKKSLSSARQNDSLSVYVPRQGIRGTDGAKFVQFAPDTDLAARVFNFNDTSDEGEIVVRLGDNVKSSLIQVSDRAVTKNVELLPFDLKAEDSRIELENMYFVISSTGQNDPRNIVKTLSLIHNGKVIDTANIMKNGGTAITSRDEDNNQYTVVEANEYYVRFDDVDEVKIDEDDTEEFVLRAELEKADGSATRYGSGSVLNITLREVNGENEDGENIVSGDLSVGSNVDYTLTTSGLGISSVTTKVSTLGSTGRIAEYTMEFKVTAFGDDIYVPFGTSRQVSEDVVGSGGIEYFITTNGDNIYTEGSVAGTINSNAKRQGNYYQVRRGETKIFTLQVNVNNTSGTTGFYGIKVDSLRYLVGSVNGTAQLLTTSLDDLETNVVYLQN